MMKRFYRPRPHGMKSSANESVFYILLDDSPESFLSDNIVRYAAKKPISMGNMTLVVNN